MKVLKWVGIVIVGLLVLNTLGNFTSQSEVERFVFAPTTAALALLTAVIALHIKKQTSER